jgi:hypothetical protein
MLDINKINSAAVFNDDWRKARLGKITASCVSELIGENSHKGSFTKGAKTFLEGLAGERLTGKPARQEFFNQYTEHGNSTEPEAIDYFCANSVEFAGFQLYAIRSMDDHSTHRLVEYDEDCACTPDALLTKSSDPNKIFDSTGNFILARSLEVKSPPVHHRFIKLYRCKTPQDLLATEPSYFWQTLSQLLFCDLMEGYFAAYNSDFKNKMRVIPFHKNQLAPELSKLRSTISHAKTYLNNLVTELS